MMKFSGLLLAFAVVVATNIHCQAQSQLEDADKSPVVKGHAMSRRQVRTCSCSGRRIPLEQNCPCELQRQNRILRKEQKACQKMRTGKNKKCQQNIGGNRKEKKVSKVASMPI